MLSYTLQFTSTNINSNTGGPPYPRAIRSKTYRGYVKPRIIPLAIYNVIYVIYRDT